MRLATNHPNGGNDPSQSGVEEAGVGHFPIHAAKLHTCSPSFATAVRTAHSSRSGLTGFSNTDTIGGTAAVSGSRESIDPDLSNTTGNRVAFRARRCAST